HPPQRIRMRREQILATQIGDDAVLGPTLVPDRFDQTDVLVDATTWAFHFHRAQEHGVSLSKTRPLSPVVSAISTINSLLCRDVVSLGFRGRRRQIVVFSAALRTRERERPKETANMG